MIQPNKLSQDTLKPNGEEVTGFEQKILMVGIRSLFGDGLEMSRYSHVALCEKNKY